MRIAARGTEPNHRAVKPDRLIGHHIGIGGIDDEMGQLAGRGGGALGLSDVATDEIGIFLELDKAVKPGFRGSVIGLKFPHP